MTPSHKFTDSSLSTSPLLYTATLYLATYLSSSFFLFMNHASFSLYDGALVLRLEACDIPSRAFIEHSTFNAKLNYGIFP
jgi:hypothetical protein